MPSLNDMLDGRDPWAALNAEAEARAEQQRADNRRSLYFDCLRDELARPQGVEVIVRVLELLGYDVPVWQANAQIHRTAALRDVADEFLADIAAASTDAYASITRTLHLRRAAQTSQKEKAR